MKAGIYKRISDDREGRELGVSRQDEDCTGLAQRIGATVVDTYTDNDRGASTRSRKPRPEYRRLLADAKAGRIDTIVAYTTGRLTRRPREHEDLIDLAVLHGITYRFVASPEFDLNTAAGRRIARILAANDAGEAEDIAERVTRETRQRAEQGRHHGGPRAYGFTADGRGLVDDEAEVLREWYSTMLAEGSIRGIRETMRRRGLLTPAGKPWHDSSIRVILLNPRNAGIRYLHSVEYPAPNPPIVSRETYTAVRRILENPARRVNHHGGKRKYVGSGLFRCQRCDITVGTKYDGTAVKLWRVYECRPRDGGCGRSWKAEPIDEWVCNILVPGLIERENARELLLPPAASDVDTRALTDEAVAVRVNMTEAAAMFVRAKGATRAALQSALDEGEARLAEIERELEHAGGTDPLAPLLGAQDPVAAWHALDDLPRRQAVVRALMTVTFGPPIRGRATWDPKKFIRIEPVR